MGKIMGGPQTMPAITIFAPAKVNLSLEVLRRRDDGYHEVRSVIQAVSLGDHLTFSPSQDLAFVCDLPGWLAEKSLVSRAATLMREEEGCRAGATVKIIKRIPLASGLGGDASDAAAVLRGLRALWRLDITPERLTELAARLGSDVPFFLLGGTALARGRGEVLSSLPTPAGHWLVVLTPALPRPLEKTATLYARLKLGDFTDGDHTDALAVSLARGDGLADEALYNAFEAVADDVFPELARYRQAMHTAGATRVHLAGAGPSLFSLHKSRAEAEAVCDKLAGQPICLAETVGPTLGENEGLRG
jgi:4-diphosphocytidyl-2-C-methyl-D-erythritol kinase